jgi:possible 2-nitropropane dioxygenase
MATRFIGTEECDASTAYKEYLISKGEKDLAIIHSPVGMPGRAVKSPMLEKLGETGRIPPKHCSRCIHSCDPGSVKYCITHALISAVEGNVGEGLFFSGANLGKLREIVSVREIMEELFPRKEKAPVPEGAEDILKA